MQDSIKERVKEIHKDNKQYLEEYIQAIKFFESFSKLFTCLIFCD